MPLSLRNVKNLPSSLQHPSSRRQVVKDSLVFSLDGNLPSYLISGALLTSAQALRPWVAMWTCLSRLHRWNRDPRLDCAEQFHLRLREMARLPFRHSHIVVLGFLQHISGPTTTYG